MKKDRSHTNSWTSEKGHADKNENRSVWQELAESEELRNDLQTLYELKARRKKNLNRFLKNINRDSYFRRKRKIYYAVAAMAVLLIGISITFRSMQSETEPLSTEPEILIPEIYYDISLKPSTGDNYVLTDFPISFSESNGVHILASSEGKIKYDDLAFPDTLSDKVLYNELIVPRGRECEITLSDGTDIHLNAQSILRYPVSFKGKKVREIYIEGEAYMKVTPNPDCPFLVKSSRLQAKVLGTSFNIKDYPDEKSYGVALVEGKVQVNNNQGDLIVLSPGEEVYSDEEQGTFGKRGGADIEGITAWIHQKLYFNNRTLEDIAKDLEKRYDIRVLFDSPETARYSFLLKAQKFSRIEYVLELLRLTHKVDYSVEGRTVTIISQGE